MKLGLQLGYWGAQPPANAPELIEAAEGAGFDAVFAAESWGSDAFTPLAWWGSRTETVRLGTSVVQISARTPTSCAMHALTLDHLNGGRTILGLGVSGPQVVEGWYGQPFEKPLARTREYVSIVRQVLAREAPVTSPGPHYPLPYAGPGSSGLGKPLKPITHPLRADIPIWLGAEGRRTSRSPVKSPTAGWRSTTPRAWPRCTTSARRRFARAGARRSREDFEVAATCQVIVTDDRAAAIAALKPMTALYVGGMGAPELNFHAQVYKRMGYEKEVDEIGRLFMSGRKDEAAAVVPDEMVTETMIIGNVDEVRADVKRWEEAGVTMLLVTCRDADHVRELAAAVGG